MADLASYSLILEFLTVPNTEVINTEISFFFTDLPC